MKLFKFLVVCELILLLITTLIIKKPNDGKCYDDSVEQIDLLMNYEENELKEEQEKNDIKFIQSCNDDISYENIELLTNIIKDEIINYDWIEYEFYLSLCGQESRFKKISLIDNDLICNTDSFLGAKYGRGISQVSEIALEEYNNKNHTDYVPTDLYNVKINVKISMWLLNKYHHGYDYNGNYFERSVEKTSLIYNNGYVVIRGTEKQKSKCNYEYYSDIMNLYNSWVD